MKLKDLTKEQMQNYCDSNNVCCCCCALRHKAKTKNNQLCLKHMINNFKEILNDEILNKEINIDLPILTDKEKEYLSAVIKPFRDRVDYVRKCYYPAIINREYILIHLGDETFTLPYFKTKEYYANMQVNRDYTLEELGL